ncbi:hypothetical protein SM0020_32937 [Sinorhizobium meliloti CCNWSX0020]|uniref:Serine protease n=1 Tax=Sinorhizobium meliloti CCNWSX0020 TaxID=1107881 RepID=H0GAM8_RHIML|nr:serine protease [Sinorhizobium meliloti]EHK73637.1 hypothetical protein SM0020_32937 [Sinorhizobium meliloti CCNWSX0020]
MLSLCTGGLGQAAAQDAVAVAARYNARVAHVETIGTLYNNSQEVGGGSGLLLGDSFVLTNDHVIPREQNYITLVVAVRLKSRLLAPLGVRAIHRDAERDLALLELNTPVSDASGPRCPMPVISDAEQVPMGSSVFVLGFPLNQDLSISGGLISNHDGGKGRWQTDTLINPGNSGGPAFDTRGALVGIAVGGITKWTFGDDVREVSGVNFIIPTSQILDSPLYAKISAMPAEQRCWTNFETAVVTSGGYEAPERLSRDHFVSETKDDHPVLLAPHSRSYQRTLEAEPGYRITSCTWRGSSENHVSDVTCNVQPAGASAVFSFRLTSGPAYDQWRGWLAGTVTLDQQRNP